MASFNTLTQDLINMIKNCSVSGCERTVFLHNDNKARAAEIEKKINELGGSLGFNYMRLACLEVRELRLGDECELQYVWGGIGQWKA